MCQDVADIDTAERIVDLCDQPVLIALDVEDVQLFTVSAVEKVFRTSARFRHRAFFVIRNHASSGPSRSPCRAAASLSFLRLMTCMPLLASSQSANIILRIMRRCQDI